MKDHDLVQSPSSRRGFFKTLVKAGVAGSLLTGAGGAAGWYTGKKAGEFLTLAPEELIGGVEDIVSAMTDYVDDRLETKQGELQKYIGETREEMDQFRAVMERSGMVDRSTFDSLTDILDNVTYFTTESDFSEAFDETMSRLELRYKRWREEAKKVPGMGGAAEGIAKLWEKLGIAKYDPKHDGKDIERLGYLVNIFNAGRDNKSAQAYFLEMTRDEMENFRSEVIKTADNYANASDSSDEAKTLYREIANAARKVQTGPELAKVMVHNGEFLTILKSKYEVQKLHDRIEGVVGTVEDLQALLHQGLEVKERFKNTTVENYQAHLESVQEYLSGWEQRKNAFAEAGEEIDYATLPPAIQKNLDDIKTYIKEHTSLIGNTAGVLGGALGLTIGALAGAYVGRGVMSRRQLLGLSDQTKHYRNQANKLASEVETLKSRVSELEKEYKIPSTKTSIDDLYAGEN